MDTTPPTLFKPADVTILCHELADATQQGTGTAAAIDNCTGGILITYWDDTLWSAVCETEYVIQRWFYAKDSCQNIDSIKIVPADSVG